MRSTHATRASARTTRVAAGRCVAMLLAFAISRLAHADAPPRLLSAPVVEAPADGSLAPRSSVALQITVSASGDVTDVRVTAGVRGDVDAQVLDAARQMRFRPAEVGGRAVAAQIQFRFRLRPPRATPLPVPVPLPLPVPPTVPVPLPVPVSVPVRVPITTPTPPTARRVAPSRGRARDREEQGITVRSHHEPGAATRESFRAEELTTVPGTFGEPTRIVASQPGVARTPFGLGFFVVRGASFENTGFFIDGFPVLILYHLGVGPAVISSRLVGQLDFYPGGYPVQYGRFTGGVISLETRPPPTDYPRIEVEVDLLRAGAVGVVPFDHGRGSVAVAARRSYYDLFLPAITSDVGFNYGDAQIRLDYRLSDRVRTSVFAFYSSDSFDRTQTTGMGASASVTRDALRFNFMRSIARVEYRDPWGTVFALSGMFGFDRPETQESDPGVQDRTITANGYVVGERASIRWAPSRVLTTTVGFDTLAYLYDVSLVASLPRGAGRIPAPQFDPAVGTLTGGITQVGISAYAEEVLRVGRTEATAGIRMENFRYTGQSHIVTDPRFVGRQRITDHVTLMMATGIFHQPPPYFALMSGFGSQTLLPQRSWQTSAGVEVTLPLNIEARLTGYFSRMWQLVRPLSDRVDSAAGTPRSAFVVSDGEGNAYGLEVLLRRRIERGVYGWLSYTFSRSERFSTQCNPSTNVCSVGRIDPFDYDQTHVLNFALSWDFAERWRVGARFQLASGTPTNGVRRGIYDSDSDAYRPQYDPLSDRLPTFHQLDVRLDYRFRLGPVRMGAFIDVLNVYNAQTSEGWIYQYDYLPGRRRPRPGTPFLPTIGIRGEL